jgi:hypothetical protein
MLAYSGSETGASLTASRTGVKPGDGASHSSDRQILAEAPLITQLFLSNTFV